MKASREGARKSRVEEDAEDALGRAQLARFLRAPSEGGSAERSTLRTSTIVFFFLFFPLFLSFLFLPRFRKKKKKSFLPTILESTIHMQKLRNYIKFSSRAIIFILLSLGAAARTTVHRDDVTRDLGYFWPLTARLMRPPDLAATKIGRGCADGTMRDHTIRGSASYGARNRKTLRFDYVVEKDMRDRRDHVIETRRTSHLH